MEGLRIRHIRMAQGVPRKEVSGPGHACDSVVNTFACTRE